MGKIFNKIPLWFINAISVISGILAILTAIISFFATYNSSNIIFKNAILTLCFFIFLLIIRIKKYQKISFEKQYTSAFVYHKLTHESRDLYFEIMRTHKDKEENIRNLTDAYQSHLSNLLEQLCDLMEKYCGQKVSSCIKLITKPDSTIDDATLKTFCRSTKSATNRGSYETSKNPIKICDNTDFLDIIDSVNGANRNYFYQGDLKAYDNKLRENGKHYRNSNPDWENDYTGTIVAPIQIEHKRLYDSLKEDSYHVIGFLCIDSKSTSAFLPRHEKSYVNIVQSFADIFYILLSQYQHYLKLINENGKNTQENS